MDCSLSEEQAMLEEAARRAATDLFGSDVAHASAAGDQSAADRGWAAVRDAGWLGLLVPESLGGSEAGLVEACIVAEALAHSLAPVPYVGTAIAAVRLLQHVGGDAAAMLQSDIAGGRAVGIALDERLSWPITTAAVGWDCGTSGECLVAQSDGPVVVTAEGNGQGADVLHPLRPIAGSPDSVVPAKAELALAAMRMGAVAGLVGTLRGAAEMAFAYVSERKQYGRPIASFQAVRHMCADVMVGLESCKSVLYGAAWTVDEGDPEEAVKAATVAKAWCADSVVTCTETVMQLLGGIGVTWESTAHLYLRQAHLYAGILGGRREVTRELGRSMIARKEATHGSS